MDQSRRAVESYWRMRTIDGATSDEDKVTPVYKLEEICDLLRASHVSIVKELSEFILKRLQHKSPVVKQKALRVIKYCVGKSGAEFRREMQRNSAAVRQLIHYKGLPDPLKGDSLNKAVRETAQETLSALFASEDAKPSPSENNLSGRIQGFGNTNFDMGSSEDKKSFLTEVVNIGSSTIKQGLSSFTQSPSMKKNETGSYRGPNLQRSLTTESDGGDRYQGFKSSNDSQNGSRFSKAASSSGNWSEDSRSHQLETAAGDSNLNYGNKTREEKLLETIVTSGGVRLQPTRDALQVFLTEALKVDALALSYALESKLQSPLWQVRMKAVCVLEAMLRKKDEEHFISVGLYFSENRDVLAKCSESPQASLREKANKVLSLLAGEETVGVGHPEKALKAEATAVQMPDLIDTGDSDDFFVSDSVELHNSQSTTRPSTSAPLIDDLFGGGTGIDLGVSEEKTNDDPFADVSFHNSSSKDQDADIFSGMNLDKSGSTGAFAAVNQSGPELFDIFGSNSEVTPQQDSSKGDINDIMTGLSINGNSASESESGTLWGRQPTVMSSDSRMNPSKQAPNDILNGMLASQTTGVISNPMLPLGASPYNMPPGFMLNPAFSPQPVDYNTMANLLAHQQLLSTMSNFQQSGNLQENSSAGSNGSYSSALPDIFNPSLPNQAPASMMSTSKKEDTRAFDFISDHLAAARDPKRVL